LTRSVLPLLAVASVALSGCVVGPNYKGPPAAAPNAAKATGFNRAEASAATTEPASKWWTALNDAELNSLVEQALAGSPDLDIARARIAQSRAGLTSARVDKLPTTGSTAAYLRSKGITSVIGNGQAASTGSASTLEIYALAFDATWEPDLFGAKARGIEGAKATAEANEAALDGVKVSLEAEVARAYVDLRQLQQRQVLSRRNAEVEARMLDLTRQRREGGTASDLDVEQLNTQLQSAQADLVPLAAQIAEQLDRLALLTGREPGALDQELAPSVALPGPPAVVAVGNPAELLRRRPDIRQAERQLVKANAVIGQRTADLFPKVTLLGSLGYTAPDLSQLLNSSSQTFVLAPILQWSPFDFGRTKAKIAQAQSAYDEAAANYRKTVLQALQDAETSLSRYGRQRENLTSLLRVQASADRSAQLQTLRQQGGTATTIEVLSTERQRIQAQLGVLNAQAQLTNDYVALQKSLGLGWL
jgi:NodT family efflux transporter outer membrane factor (OMF) lipoprotein